MNESKKETEQPLLAEPGPYQVVVWNLTFNPPRAKLINLPDPRAGFIEAFNRGHADQSMVANTATSPPVGRSHPKSAHKKSPL